jgi:hypothetical protein
VGELRSLLLRCGGDSKIIPSAVRLEQMECSYGKYREEKSVLLDIVSMWRATCGGVFKKRFDRVCYTG